MRKILECRRSSLALLGMIILGVAMWSGHNTADSIAMICIGIGASNSYENSQKAHAEAKTKGEK